MGKPDQFAKSTFAEETKRVTGGAITWKDSPEIGLESVQGDGLLLVRRPEELIQLRDPWREAPPRHRCGRPGCWRRRGGRSLGILGWCGHKRSTASHLAVTYIGPIRQAWRNASSGARSGCRVFSSGGNRCASFVAIVLIGCLSSGRRFRLRPPRLRSPIPPQST